jgi:ubiquinone/menaquinone biosynthesis C-methylase UbiE
VPWLLATVYDWSMREVERACLAQWRAEIVAPLAGDVLEVGAGTGLTLRHYPPAVMRLVVAEPDRHMRARLAQRAAESGRAVEVSDAGLEKLPWPEASFDAVVSTLVLCTVPDVPRALAEIHRVLRPGGVLAFLEHVAADEGSARFRWQRRFEPLWKRLTAGCHLTRRTAAAITEAGFEHVRLTEDGMRKAMPLVRPVIRGLAAKVTDRNRAA